MDPTPNSPESPPEESAPPAQEVNTDDAASQLATPRWLWFGLLTGLMLVVLFLRPIQRFTQLAVVTYHGQRAEEAFVGGNITAAIEEVNAALEWMPSAPQLIYLRAQLYAADEDWSSSLEDYNRLIDRLAPLFARAYLGRAHVYRRTGAFDKAHADLERVMNLSPTIDQRVTGEILYQRSLLYLAEGNAELATPDLAESRRLGYRP